MLASPRPSMLPLLVPVLAQMLTITVGDRTEGRYQKVDDRRWELTTTPGIALDLRVRRYNFSLGYSPSLLVTPLETKPREYLVFHDLSASTGYSWKTTSVSFGSTLRFGEVNFRTAPLQNLGGGQPVPTPGGEPGVTPDPGTTPDPGAMPTPGEGPAVDPTAPGGQAQTRTVDRIVNHIESITTLSVSRAFTRQFSAGGYLSYGVTGAIDERDRLDYPLTAGWTLGGTAYHTQPVGSRDAFVTSALGQAGWGNSGNNVSMIQVDEAWKHTLRPQTRTTLGVGVSVTRTAQTDGLVAVSIFPTFVAGIDDTEKLAGGELYASINTYSNPVLDPLRSTVDPRVGASAFLSWTRAAFNISLNGSAALSVAPEGNDASSTDGYAGAASMGYEVIEGLSVDTGARGTARSVQGATVVPPSWAIFAGVSVGHAFVLKLGR